MGTTPRIVLIAAVWLLYVFILTRSCSPVLCLGCGADGERFPIDFSWNDPTPHTNAGYGATKAELLAGQEGNNIFEITGLYFDGEEAPSGFGNMGLARAEAARQLLVPDLPQERVLEKSLRIHSEEDSPEGFFEALQTSWIEEQGSYAPTFEQLFDRIHIRFPFASDVMDYDPEVNQFLDDLAQRLLNSNARLDLTGHTDNVGSDASNMDLGMKRAEDVRAVLLEKGAPEDKISVDSRGSGQPIASNDTARGRHENRRVELRIIEP